MLNPRKSNPWLRWTILVLASLKARPLGSSHSASRALTCSACARDAHRAARSSAYLTRTGVPGAARRVLPSQYRTPAACSMPCSATFMSAGLITPPWGDPSPVGANRPSSITPALSRRRTRSRAGKVPSEARM